MYVNSDLGGAGTVAWPGPSLAPGPRAVTHPPSVQSSEPTRSQASNILHHIIHFTLQVHLVLLVLGNISNVLGLKGLGLSSDLVPIHHHVRSQCCSGRIVATHFSQPAARTVSRCGSFLMLIYIVPSNFGRKINAFKNFRGDKMLDLISVLANSI